MANVAAPARVIAITKKAVDRPSRITTIAQDALGHRKTRAGFRQADCKGNCGCGDGKAGGGMTSSPASLVVTVPLNAVP